MTKLRCYRLPATNNVEAGLPAYDHNRAARRAALSKKRKKIQAKGNQYTGKVVTPDNTESPTKTRVLEMTGGSPWSLVNFGFLKANGIVDNRTSLARAISNYGFPRPLVLSPHRIAWVFDEVQAWLASRPRAGA
jgi:hypothetical protein